MLATRLTKRHLCGSKPAARVRLMWCGPSYSDGKLGVASGSLGHSLGGWPLTFDKPNWPPAGPAELHVVNVLSLW